jgi:hypothetical protein
MSPQQLVLAVIRGERPVASLRTAGLAGKKSAFVVRPTMQDVAAGLLHYAKRSRGGKGWAEFLIRSDLVELPSTADNPEWAAILAAIWDVSSGLPASEESQAATRQILSGRGKR